MDSCSFHKIEGDEANSRYWYSRSGLYFYDSYNDLQHELRVIKNKLPN